MTLTSWDASGLDRVAFDLDETQVPDLADRLETSTLWYLFPESVPPADQPGLDLVGCNRAGWTGTASIALVVEGRPVAFSGETTLLDPQGGGTLQVDADHGVSFRGEPDGTLTVIAVRDGSFYWSAPI